MVISEHNFDNIINIVLVFNILYNTIIIIIINFFKIIHETINKI